jgi:hypothetical protein
MNPDDNFSPPLDGLSRGNKLHQVLTTLNDADYISETKYVDKQEVDSKILAVVDVNDIIDIEDHLDAAGMLFCNWWHMRREPDWWKFEYIELGPEAEVEPIEDSEEDEEGVRVEVTYSCGWYQQENDEVEGLTYYEEFNDGEWKTESFKPAFEAARPLSSSIIDTYLPENIQNRY